ncbi:MAG TPA: hypothetical protein VE174_13775 [Actinomycetota bacterium]|nr:hypothetical protein [Actinomycetota bacterium]
MRTVKRLTLVGIIGLLITALVTPPVAVAQSDDLNYSIKEARAYAQKASLDKNVVEAVPKCNPDEDKYKCDEGQWNHKPNCPKEVEIGPSGKVPTPKPPDAEAASGGAGDTAGGEQPPPQSSPIRYNRFVALGTLSRIAGLNEARGFASRIYVDLSGRDDGEAHTESEAVGTQRRWEERCFPDGAANDGGSDYSHMFSRSNTQLSTYHFTECHKRDCFEQATGPGTFGADAEKATAIVDLHEEDGEVVGKLSSVVEDLNYGGGALTIESVETFIDFRSDGTPQGLKWSVSSTANGVKLGGQPITLPPGEMISQPGIAVGMAAPYVNASEDGTKLTIVAAGLTLGTDQQAVFVGGAELLAGFGGGLGDFELPPLDETEPPTTTDVGGGGGDDITSPVGGIGSVGGSSGFDVAAPLSEDATAPVAAGEPEEILIYEMATGRGAVPAIIALGIVMWFLLLSRWLQRFTWGRKLTRYQPFRTVDWVYRAFVKT